MRAAHLLAGGAIALVATVAVEAGETLSPAVDHAFKHYVEVTARLTPILASVKDKASADAAAAPLKAALVELYEARSELQRITALSDEEKRLVQQKYEMTMRKEWGVVFDHIFRLQRAKCYESLAFFKQFQTMCMMLEK